MPRPTEPVSVPSVVDDADPESADLLLRGELAGLVPVLWWVFTTLFALPLVFGTMASTISVVAKPSDAVTIAVTWAAFAWVPLLLGCLLLLLRQRLAEQEPVRGVIDAFSWSFNIFLLPTLAIVRNTMILDEMPLIAVASSFGLAVLLATPVALFALPALWLCGVRHRAFRVAAATWLLLLLAVIGSVVS